MSGIFFNGESVWIDPLRMDGPGNGNGNENGNKTGEATYAGALRAPRAGSSSLVFTFAFIFVSFSTKGWFDQGIDSSRG